MKPGLRDSCFLPLANWSGRTRMHDRFMRHSRSSTLNLKSWPARRKEEIRNNLKYLLGVLTGVLILPLCVYLLLLTGFVPVATSSAELPLEKSIARMAIRGRVN